MAKTLKEIVKFNTPVVVIPVNEYEQLLKEAGYIKPPELNKDITYARKRFKEGKFIKWETLKNELI